MTEFRGDLYPLRDPCVECGGDTGRITTKNGQDCVCCLCGRHQYNAPKTETGRKVRTVAGVHAGIKPKQRARILGRATGRCEMCGSRTNLHVGHILSVDSGLKLGMTESQLNDDENLAAMCETCNLGVGKEPVSARLLMAIVLERLTEDTPNQVVEVSE